MNLCKEKVMNYLEQFYTTNELLEYTGDDYNLLYKLYDELQPIIVPIGSLKNNFSNEDYKICVDSPDGWVDVLDCVEKTKNEMYNVEFSNDVNIDASHDHLFQKETGEWCYTKDLVNGDNIISDTGSVRITNITKYFNDTLVYDLSVNHENHRYYTEGVCSHNTGKSLFLMNTAIYGMEQNLNVMYITLELNPELCARRMYSMITKMSQKELYVNLDTTQGIVKKFETKAGGKTQIKYMPSGTKVSEISAFCEEFMITTGKKIDILCVDYLDLVDPSRTLNKSSNVFDKDKAVSEEIRNFGQEHGIVVVTAAQAGRSAVGVEDLDHSHISGGISKINTADLVLGIITSNAMRERGQYQLQVMKTRNSAGTGRKVDLKVSEVCMKIEDDPDFIKNLNAYMANPVKAPNPSTMTNTERMFAEVQNEINKNDPAYNKVDLTSAETKMLEDDMDDNEIDKITKMLQNNNFK